MGSKDRITRKKQEVHSAILLEALEILQQEGIEAISMRRIADKIEYSPPVIYCHYKNKDALLFALLAHGYRQLNKEINDALKTSLAALERIELLMSCYIDFAIKNRELYILMFRVGLADPKAVTDLPEATLFTRMLQIEIAEYEKEVGGYGYVGNVQIYFLLVSLAHGMVSVNYFSDQFDTEGLKLNLKNSLKGIFNNVSA